ncbi:MAG: type II secretion system F family protein [Magnetococcales bacterium]|nr:type II secretion system F family protein [Magnetococcales bacterium]
MPHYHYKASNPQGSIRHGSMEAENERDLEQRLTSLDLLLISHKQDGERSLSFFSALFNRRVERKTLILFCLHMEQMLSAGNSIPTALEGVRESVDSPRFQEAITTILVDIQNGKNLSDALGSYPSVFPSFISSLVRVGERTGKMVEVFQGLGENLKWEDELESQAKQAIRYPAFTGVVILGVGAFMMVYVVPQLMSFLSQVGDSVPFYTQALLLFSDFLINWWWSFLLVPVLGLFAVRLFCRLSPSFHLKVDRFKLRIWFFGPLIYKIFLVRFTANFALMYRSGVPVLEAIEINGRLSENREVLKRMQQVVVRVSHGLSISAAFKEAGVFPPPLPKLMEAGEEGGQLSSALMNASYFLDREVRESVTRLQSMIEPILTLTMGLLLAWIILSVFAPIYQSVSNMSY